VFLETSRYYGQKITSSITPDGRTVSAIKLRLLPDTEGTPTMVKGNDRLDILAERRYGDAARYWHIADANSELKASRLVSQAGRTINVPEQ